MAKLYQILLCDEEPSYRYRLDVSTLLQSSKGLAIVQLNPSTADATKSDPTIGKVSYWAREHGFGCVTFLNLFAIRTAHPKELVGKPYEVLVGPRNDAVTRPVLSAADTIIFAWGKVDAAIAWHFGARHAFLKRVVGEKPVYAVGEPVATSFPRHGRMWNGMNRKPRPYEFG
jgi:hypothetical protein